MVFFFTSSEGWTIYMGLDKYENEDLIRWGLDTDIWFHVDNLSSAHVYLRMPGIDMQVQDVPPSVIEECAQLVKANSIEGCKLNGVPIVYTPWSNLKKTGSMEVGQVGFHDNSKVFKTRVERKIPFIINRLKKTRVEKVVNFQRLSCFSLF